MKLSIILELGVNVLYIKLGFKQDNDLESVIFEFLYYLICFHTWWYFGSRNENKEKENQKSKP